MLLEAARFLVVFPAITHVTDVRSSDAVHICHMCNPFSDLFMCQLGVARAHRRHVQAVGHCWQDLHTEYGKFPRKLARLKTLPGPVLACWQQLVEQWSKNLHDE